MWLKKTKVDGKLKQIAFEMQSYAEKFVEYEIESKTLQDLKWEREDTKATAIWGAKQKTSNVFLELTNTKYNVKSIVSFGPTETTLVG